MMCPKLHKPVDKVQQALINSPNRLARIVGGQIHRARLAANPEYPSQSLTENHLYALEHPDHDPEYVRWWQQETGGDRHDA